MMGKPAAAVLVVALATRPKIWWSVVRRQPRSSIMAMLLLLALVIPAVQSAISDEGSKRFQDVKIDAEPGRLLYQAASHWLTYWSPQYLLMKDAEGFPRWPTVGNMGYAQWFCLLVGVAALVSRPSDCFSVPLLLFALLAMVPASITNTIAPSRVLFAAPILASIAGRGAQVLTQYLGVARAAPVLLGGLAVTLALLTMDMRSEMPALGRFFRQDQLELTQRLVAAPGEHRFIDASIPFALEFAAYASSSDSREIQAVFGSSIAGPVFGAFGGVGIADPILLRVSRPGSLWMTWKDRPAAGWRTVDSIGGYRMIAPARTD